MTKAILALPLILASCVGGAQSKDTSKTVNKKPPTEKTLDTSPTDVNPRKPEAKEPARGPAIPVDVQNTYLKINLKLKTEQQAMEQTPLYQDMQKVSQQLNDAVVVMQKICGDKFTVNLDQDQTPICVTKPAPPAPPKPEVKK